VQRNPILALYRTTHLDTGHISQQRVYSNL